MVKKEWINKNKKILICCAAFLGTWAVQWILQFSGDKLEYTNSIFSVVVFAILVVFLQRLTDYRFKTGSWIFPAIYGMLFSVCMVWGTHIELYDEDINFLQPDMWLAILILGILAALLVRYLWDKMYELTNGREERTIGIQFESNTKIWLIYLVLILLCYLPVFLAVYPGFFTYDAAWQLSYAAHSYYSTHHPLLHSFLLGETVQGIYDITGNYNLGIAIYTIGQMIIMSGIFSGCIVWLKNRGLSRCGRIVLALYFGLFPVLVMFSLCTTKDGLFSGFMLLTVLLLTDMYKETENFWKNKKKIAGLLITSCLMLLFRNNAIYAFYVYIPFVFLLLRKKWKKVLIYIVAVLILYNGINELLITSLKAELPGRQEMLTVPINQLARVHQMKYDSITEKEKEMLYQYIPEEYFDYYRRDLSDPVKNGFNNKAFWQNKTDFIRVWTSFFMKYPETVISAWLMNCYGFWYPDTVINVYRGHILDTVSYEDSSYFAYETEKPGTRESKIEWLDEWYRKLSLEIYQQKVPVISMFFAPGFLFWIVLLLIGNLCYQKRFENVAPYLMPMFYWLTLLLGPTFLTRYVVFLWMIVVPLLWENLKEKY